MPETHAPALLLQDSAYSYRVWITLIKLLYVPLQYPNINPYIHQDERLCGRLLPSVRRVSEKNSYRQLAEQAGSCGTDAQLIHSTYYPCTTPLCRNRFELVAAIHWGSPDNGGGAE